MNKENSKTEKHKWRKQKRFEMKETDRVNEKKIKVNHSVLLTN